MTGIKNHPSISIKILGTKNNSIVVDSINKNEFLNDIFRWEAVVTGSDKYQSEIVLNLEIKHYAQTGHAGGYIGLSSLLFNLLTGKLI